VASHVRIIDRAFCETRIVDRAFCETRIIDRAFCETPERRCKAHVGFI